MDAGSTTVAIAAIFGMVAAIFGMVAIVAICLDAAFRARGRSGPNGFDIETKERTDIETKERTDIETKKPRKQPTRDAS
jgi:hypothetical protein